MPDQDTVYFILCGTSEQFKCTFTWVQQYVLMLNMMLVCVIAN